MKSFRPRGVILAVSFILTFLILMFAGAIYATGGSRLALSGSTVNAHRAQAAVESGLQYAQARLREDLNWRGNANAVVVNDSTLYVEEENGNVVGLLLNDGKVSAQFRIRFNHYDGPGGKDQLDDPTKLRFEHPFVSFNNLSGPASVPIHRGDGSNQEITGSSAQVGEAGSFTAAILVEGRAGDGLRNLSSTEPNRAPVGEVVTRVSEFQLRAGRNDVQGAAVMAAGDIIVELTNQPKSRLIVGSSDPEARPTLRTKTELSMLGGDPSGNFESPKGVVRQSDDNSLAFGVDPVGPVDLERENSTDDFYTVSWADVDKADPSTATLLPAGTYVMSDSGEVHYFDMSLAKYAELASTGILPDQKISSHDMSEVATNPGNIYFKTDGTVLRLVVEDDVSIKATSNTEEFNFIPKSGALEAPASPTLPDYLHKEYYAAFEKAVDHGVTGLANPASPTAAGILASIGGSNDPALAEKILSPIIPALKGVAGGDEPGKIDLGAKTDSLEAQDIALIFAPRDSSANLTNPQGNVVLGARVLGQGGSVVADGNLRVIGSGSELAAATNPQEGISFYSTGDLTFSSYNSSSTEFQNLNLKGVLYSQGDINVVLSEGAAQPGFMKLDGAIVAYGGDPTGPVGSETDKGEVNLKGRRFELNFDSAYVAGMETVPTAELSPRLRVDHR